MIRRGESGLTAVELLLSLALTALVVALTLPLAGVQKRVWERQEQRREAGRALAGAASWLTRDLQQAGYHAAGSPLQQVSAEALTYLVSRDEADPAGFSLANRRRITAWLDAGDLKYRIQAPLDAAASTWESGSTQVLASGLLAMQCRGLDAAGAETASAGAVALVECELSGAGERLPLAVRLRAGAGCSP